MTDVKSSKDDVQRCPHGISLTAVPPCHFCDHAQYVEWASPQLERLGHEMADNARLRAALRKASERFSWLARFHLNAEYSKRAARDLSEEFWKVQAGEIQQDETTTEQTTVVYKNGTYKKVPSASAWEYQNDPDWLVTIPAVESRETSRCIHDRVVCEPCAQMAVRFHEKTIALAQEISERHTRINKLLYGPEASKGMMLGPMDSDAAHADRGRLLSMLTPEQRGTVEPTPERLAQSTWTCEHCARVNDTDTTFNRCPFCGEFRKGYAEKAK